MRKNSARKWLHATLDLLPVILIPVFMIYSHRHTIDNYQVNYSQNEVVDFNQLNNFNNYNNNYASVNNYLITFDFNIDSNSYILINEFNQVQNHKYYLRTTWNNPEGCQFYIFTSENALLNNYGGIYTSNSNNPVYCRLFVYDTYLNTDVTFSSYVNIFDLTQMFGSGNEPTIQQFNDYFPNDYYEYTTSKKVLLKDVDTIIYDDTDIGSQFMYCLYNSVDKYFNMNNVFNMNNIYDWFSLNIFNGNPPLAIYIVWNIVLYEFVMDLLFLLYALFMFFIDTCTNLMDRFYGNLSGRR